MNYPQYPLLSGALIYFLLMGTFPTEIILMCLSIGTPKNNKFSICSKWKIHYFEVSQNLGRLQPHYNVLEYLDI